MSRRPIVVPHAARSRRGKMTRRNTLRTIPIPAPSVLGREWARHETCQHENCCGGTHPVPPVVERRKNETSGLSANSGREGVGTVTRNGLDLVEDDTSSILSPDGQRFLALEATDFRTTGPTEIHLVLNWFEELKARVPTK